MPELTAEQAEARGLKGWGVVKFDELHVTVFPINDLIEHDKESDDCICGPLITPVERDNGEVAWIYTHHALDGRD